MLACTDIAEHGPARRVDPRRRLAARSTIAALLASVRTELGEIDILVNNAGVAQAAAAGGGHGEGQIDEMLAVNLKSAFLLTQAKCCRECVPATMGTHHQPVQR